MTPTANGNHAALEDALHPADGDTFGAPKVPEAPKPPALYSPEWFDIQVRALDADQQQKYAAWQQSLGRLDALRQLQAMSAQQQAHGEEG